MTPDPKRLATHEAPTVALSIRQPWAWAIMHAGKRIENRSWSTTFRGPFFVHAAKGCTRDEYLDAVHWMVSRGLVRSNHFRSMHTEKRRDDAPLIPPLATLHRGGIVGRARVVEVIHPSPIGVVAEPWHMAGQFGFVFEDVEALPFLPARGALGFFKVAAEAMHVDG